MTTKYTIMPSPLGDILLARNEAGMTDISFQAGSEALTPDPVWERDDSVFDDVIGQLNEYFAGERRTFELTLAPQGTPFQLQVWSALQAIPYGETSSYGELATTLGNPKASRAVGAANGRNPLPIVIPCHRVIGSNGKLTGFRGGLQFKEALLSLEQQGEIQVTQQLALL